MAKTDTSRRASHIAVVAFDGCSSWIATGLVELFAIANAASMLIARGPGRTAQVEFHVSFISWAKQPVRAAHGARLQLAPLRRHYDAVIVPPLWSPGVAELAQQVERLQRHSDFLTGMATRTTHLAAACSGVVLLAQAGLLEGARA